MTDNVRAQFPAAKQVRLALRKLNPPTCQGHPAYSEVRIGGKSP